MLLPLLLLFFTRQPLTELYTLSLHDALPISLLVDVGGAHVVVARHPQAAHVVQGAGGIGARDRQKRVLGRRGAPIDQIHQDRKSTRLNSSHGYISYAVFCLKKKNNKI